MADMNSTPSRAAPRLRTKTTKTREALPVYGAGAGVLSFRHGLPAQDIGVIDRALEIVARSLREPGTAMADPEAVMQYIRMQIGGESVEVFCVMYLDSQNRVIAFDKMFTGTLKQTSVHPREVVRAALAHGAAAVILAHNHPSGNVRPSNADIGLTETLVGALHFIDVRVLDHVIVGPNASQSMRMIGLI